MSKATNDSQLRDRFWAKVEWTDDLFSCWLWRGSRTRDGYGNFRWIHPTVGDLTREGAHRVAFYLTRGWLPECVLHTCDVPACVRPEHLKAGTVADNMKDRKEKGRYCPAPCSRFSPEDVTRIREAVAAGVSESLLAKQYNLSKASLAKIAMGKTYRQIAGPRRGPRRKVTGPRKNRSSRERSRQGTASFISSCSSAQELAKAS